MDEFSILDSLPNVTHGFVGGQSGANILECFAQR
jgi:hypothetical protein